MVAAGGDGEDALVERKCGYEGLRRNANEPVGRARRSVTGIENLYGPFPWPRDLAKIYRHRIAYRLSHLALLPVCNEG